MSCVCTTAEHRSPFQTNNLGKPAPGLDGVIRLNLARTLTVWPLNPGNTYEVRVSAVGPGGVGESARSNPFTFGAPLSVTDFNRDGHVDLLWQHPDGEVSTWLMNGTSLIEGRYLYSSGTSWRVMASGDFNGDGQSDVVWQDAAGAVVVWLMSGTNLVSAQFLYDGATEWRVVGAGDFNDDRKADLVWQHPSGAVVLWLMNGTALIAGVHDSSGSDRVDSCRGG